MTWISLVAKAVSLGLLVSALILLLQTTRVEEPQLIVYVAYDSCGYEVARNLNKYYPSISGIIVSPGQHIENTCLEVHLATNISLLTSHGATVAHYKSTSKNTIYTDVLSDNGLLKNHDLWSYCLTNDNKTLEKIAREIQKTLENTENKFNPQLPIATLLAVIGTAGLTISFLDEIKEFMRKHKIPLLAIPVLLRTKIKYEDALEHPLRRQIYELISRNGAIPFSKILELGSKAVIEWHTFILIRSGLIKEIKIGRGSRKKRYLVKPDPEVVYKVLSQLDERVECIIKHRKLSIEKITEICSVDRDSATTILKIISEKYLVNDSSQ